METLTLEGNIKETTYLLTMQRCHIELQETSHSQEAQLPECDMQEKVGSPKVSHPIERLRADGSQKQSLNQKS